MQLNRADLESMDVEALNELSTTIGEILDAKRNEALNAFRAELEERAKKLGLNVSGIFKQPTKKVAPQFRNPANPSETWAGRGREPLWYAALDEAGRKAARIVQDEPAPSPEAPAAPEAPAKAGKTKHKDKIAA